MSHSAASSACPACVAAPAARELAQVARGTVLSLPGIHCGACIATVEKALLARPDVQSARVNLTQKRVVIEASGVPASDLITTLERTGYEAHELDATALGALGADREGRDLLMRLGVAGFAMMNVMLMSVAVWAGATEATRDLFHWISATIAIPVIAFSARPFLANALSALRVGRLNMDVPITLAILLATGMSVYETASGGVHAYFDAALSLTFFLLAGRYLDHRTRRAARSAANELTALEVPRATRIEPEGEVVVAAAELDAGDLIRVRPGGRIPADGTIIEGASEVDRSLLTGESLPDDVDIGSPVSAGELNLTGPLVVRVSAAGSDTSLHRLAELVAVAEAARTRYNSLANRAAAIYAPAVHVIAFSGFVAWFWTTGDVRVALNVAVATLIITCPCALGLAVPAVSTAAAGRLFRRGILVKDATALERLAETDTVVFDKTGTLTEGRPQLLDPGPGEHSVALALASASSHPLAQALAEGLARRGIAPAPLSDVMEVPGHGVQGLLGGRTVRLGRPDWTGACPVDQTATYLSDGRAYRFTDTLRPGAKAAIEGLRGQGYDVLLLSGDQPSAVADIARQVGIDAFDARMRPEDKAARIAALLARGARS